MPLGFLFKPFFIVLDFKILEAEVNVYAQLERCAALRKIKFAAGGAARKSECCVAR